MASDRRFKSISVPSNQIALHRIKYSNIRIFTQICMCELMREFACVHFVLDFGVQIRIIKFICTLFI